jgi:glutamate N-acetyltransferase/amino-acid N-acetyltransferase
MDQTYSLPVGFKAVGSHIGVKKGKSDLSLIVSDTDCVFAGVFTTNAVKAAPVVWDMALNAGGGTARAIAAISGNANACTGDRGHKDNRAIAETMAELIGCKTREVLVASTGVIGVPMPIDTVKEGIRNTFPLLSDSTDGAMSAAQAILTTDTFPKTICFEAGVGGRKVRFFGMAKGSGMIHPNMATMLSFILTDAAISKAALSRALKESADLSFNMVSVDGDTSTNDTALALANGRAGNPIIEEGSKDYVTFMRALSWAAVQLAKDIARDGEGATKFIEVYVDGAKSLQAARTLARSVVSSNLFKAAIFGSDANWGRALCAMGCSGAQFSPERVYIEFESGPGNVRVIEAGQPLAFDEDLAKRVLSEKEIFVGINVGDGSYSAMAWGCDLTYDYVRINGDYRS